ncbi:MAG: efflux transporter outer membrane subunit [Desulfosalsimonas sp.]
MKKSSLPKTVFFVLFVFAAGACMKSGPDYSRPDTGFEVPGSFNSAGGTETSAYVAQNSWWEAFGDRELNRAVMEAVKNNPDVAGAAAGIMEARAVFEQTASDRLPSVDLEASASTQQQAVINPVTGQTVTVERDDFTLSIPASFELDLWGRLARASQAARADLLAAEQNRRTVVQSLVAETVDLYLKIRSLDLQIKITREMVETHENKLDLVRNRYQQGLASALDVRQAGLALAQAAAGLPSLVESRGRAAHSLSVLKGGYPENRISEYTENRDFRIPPPVPAGLPSQLLARRADVLAAEASLEAASARIGVARADRFPRISLTGSFGYTSGELSGLFEPESRLWRMAAGGFQPVFDGGAGAARERAARARYEREAASYAKTVLNAFAEVEDSLFARRQLLERRERIAQVAAESRAALEIAEDRYERGLEGYFNVIDARHSLYQAELDLVQAGYEIQANRVKLHRALGGGWDKAFDIYGEKP